MLTREEAKELIKETVRLSIINFAKSSLRKKPKFQILDLIIPKERKIRSIVGGLETSLGTTLWEPLAKSLASNNGFEVIDSNLECPEIMPSNLNNVIQSVLDERKQKTGIYDAISSHEAIKKVCQAFIARPINEFEKAPRGRGIDIWLKKNDVHYFFDTKTVQPNIGAFFAYTQQIIYWYAYFYSRYPQENAQARIVFPYNPYDGEFWDKAMGKGEPLEKGTEAWVENEFWDFCSGLDDTYRLIEKSFEELRESKILEKELDSLFY